jgi:hypothetical protein
MIAEAPLAPLPPPEGLFGVEIDIVTLPPLRFTSAELSSNNADSFPPPMPPPAAEPLTGVVVVDRIALLDVQSAGTDDGHGLEGRGDGG